MRLAGKNNFWFLVFLIFRIFNIYNSSNVTEKVKETNISSIITHILPLNISQMSNYILNSSNVSNNTTQNMNTGSSSMPSTLQNYIQIYFIEPINDNKESHDSSYEESFALERYFSIQSLVIGNMLVIIVLLMTIKSCKNIKQKSGNNNLNLFNMYEY